jgi:hypothetical protein
LLELLIPANTGKVAGVTRQPYQEDMTMTTRKNRMLATTSLAIITAALAAAFSQSSNDDRGGTTAPELEGGWRVRVTPAVGAPIPPFLTFSTFGRGGTFLESTQPGQGPGHGVWRRTGGREFVITFEKILLSSEGNFAGTLKVREAIRLSASGDSYTGDATAEAFDPSGHLVGSFCAKTQATRIIVERPSCP